MGLYFPSCALCGQRVEWTPTSDEYGRQRMDSPLFKTPKPGE